MQRVYVSAFVPEDIVGPLRSVAAVGMWDGGGPAPREVMLQQVVDCVGLLSMLVDTIDTELLDTAPRLRVISQMSVGLDNVDLEACEVRGIRVYDDFAHHPTAVATTIDGLRRRDGGRRIVAVLEPRSNTMRLGHHRAGLTTALAGADRVWLYQPTGLGWNLGEIAGSLGGKAAVADDLPTLVAALTAELKSGDEVLIMSNRGFGGLHEKLLQALRAAPA